MRKRFNFWLDDNRPHDWQINELITTLKRAGQFTRAIREGLRLWVDLRANKTDVLYELFPHMKPPAAQEGNGGAGGLDEIKGLLEMIASQQKSGNGYLMQTAQPATGKPLPVPTLALPTFDEDEELPTLIISKNMNTDSARNFVNSLRGVE